MASRWSQDGPKCHQDGPKMAQDGIKYGQDAPKMAQDGSGWLQDDLKTAQDGPKKARSLQDSENMRLPLGCLHPEASEIAKTRVFPRFFGVQHKPVLAWEREARSVWRALSRVFWTPKWPQERPKLAQDSPKNAQDGAKLAQDGPKLAQDAPSWPHDGPKSALKYIQDGPKSLQAAIRCPDRCPATFQKTIQAYAPSCTRPRTEGVRRYSRSVLQ